MRDPHTSITTLIVNTAIFAGEAEIWFRYHFPEEVADTLTWGTVRESLRAFFTPPKQR